MIQTLIDILDAAVALHLPTVKRHGLAELHPIDGGGTQPVVYSGDGSFNQIANDNAGSFSYWRLNGSERTTKADVPGQACEAFALALPLRYVAMVDRERCPLVQDSARAALWAAMATGSSIRPVIQAIVVDFGSTSIDADTRRVYQQEFGTALQTADKAFVAIDITVVVTGRAECFDPCDTPTNFLCALIQNRTWLQIKACMTDAQIEAAIEDLCDTVCPTECEVLAAITDPLTVAPCVEDEMAIAMGGSFIARPAYTVDILNEQIRNAGKDEALCALLCPPVMQSCYWRSISLGT